YPFNPGGGRTNPGGHTSLPNPPREGLRVLRAVIEDENARAHQWRHSDGSRTRNSTCFVSRSRMAADGVPKSQPHASPGFTINVSPRDFISCLCVPPCMTIAWDSIERCCTSPMSCTRGNRCPPISKLCGESNSSVPKTLCALVNKPCLSPSLLPYSPSKESL